MAKCPVYKYDNRIYVGQGVRVAADEEVEDDTGKEDKTIQPLPKSKKKVIDAAIRRLKDKGCKTQWLFDDKRQFKRMPIRNYGTFQIQDTCLDLASIEEGRLDNEGITFDTGYGFGWRDWELDYITVCKPKRSSKINKKLREMEAEAIRTLMPESKMRR